MKMDNKLPEEPTSSPLDRFISQLLNPLTYVLFAACLLRLQAATLYANIRLSIPADISISSAALQKDALASFLNQPQNAALCHGYEFVAAPVTQGTLTSFAQLSALKPTVAFLTPHYLDLM